MDFNSKYKKVRADMDRLHNESFGDVQIMDAVENTHLTNDTDAEKVFDPDIVTGIPSGFPSLDKLIKGIRMATCTILAADTGMGKSLFAIKILTNLAKSGIKVCYFDLENGRATSLRRIFGIWFEKLVSWFESKSNEDEFKSKASEVVNFSYYDHDKLYSLGFEEKGHELILSLMEQHAKKGAKVFLVDPLQIFISAKEDSKSSRMMSTAVRKFKEFAQSYNVAVIICHHIRKSTSGNGAWISGIEEAKKVFYKNPTLDDIKGLSDITQTATDVWGLVRTKLDESKLKRGDTILSILKNRNGREGFVSLFLNEDNLVFEELEPMDYFNKENSLGLND